MEEYLKILLEQIRCRKAHPYIEEELRDHMEEQLAANMAAGMKREEAEKAAVRDMGDPVEVGISLDRIHRPQAAWQLIALIAVISVLGIVIHKLICYQFMMSGNSMTPLTGSFNYVKHTLLGIALMCVIYFVDYTVIAKYAKIIAAAMLGIAFAGSGVYMNGQFFYIYYGTIHISITMFLMLYVPVYGAVLYKYYGTGYIGVVKSVIWLLLPVYFAARIPSTLLMGVLLISMLVLLTIAVAKGWFAVQKKIVIAAIWTVFAVLPAAILTGLIFFGGKSYRLERIRAFYLHTYSENNYISNCLHNFHESSRFVGTNGMEKFSSFPNCNSDYIFTYLVSEYGMIAGVLITCLMAVLVIWIFSAALHQKNQLGMMMGCGCGMLFLLNTGINILENLSFFPATQTFLPFLSAGGSSIVFSYLLIGIVISIYRYKNVYPQHIRTKIQMTIDL